MSGRTVEELERIVNALVVTIADLRDNLADLDLARDRAWDDRNAVWDELCDLRRRYDALRKETGR